MYVEQLQDPYNPSQNIFKTMRMSRQSAPVFARATETE
jgi:hypothetical protein